MMYSVGKVESNAGFGRNMGKRDFTTAPIGFVSGGNVGQKKKKDEDEGEEEDEESGGSSDEEADTGGHHRGGGQEYCTGARERVVARYLG